MWRLPNRSKEKRSAFGAAELHRRLRDDWWKLLWYPVCGVLRVRLYLSKNTVHVQKNKQTSHL